MIGMLEVGVVVMFHLKVWDQLCQEGRKRALTEE